MSDRTEKNEDRYKALGFKSCFDGTASGIQWSELIEELKTNVLRQSLRVRKLVMGEYDTKSGKFDLAKIPGPLLGSRLRLRSLKCATKAMTGSGESRDIAVA